MSIRVAPLHNNVLRTRWRIQGNSIAHTRIVKDTCTAPTLPGSPITPTVGAGTLVVMIVVAVVAVSPLASATKARRERPI